MKNQAAIRTIETYQPARDLTERYPEWRLTAAIPGALSESWVSFNPHFKIAVVRPDIMESDQGFATAFIVALLDLGADKSAALPADLVQDAEDMADMRLGAGLPLDDFPSDGPPSVILGGDL